MRAIRAAVLCLPVASCAVSCIQSHDDSRPAAVHDAPESNRQAEPPSAGPEGIGEAEEPYTKADCYAAWKHNMTQCTTPECWALVSVLLGVCLKGAED